MDRNHSREVVDMAARMEQLGALFYIGTGLAWMAYLLTWERAPWLAELFGGAFD